jgi:hypothetical protein
MYLIIYCTYEHNGNAPHRDKSLRVIYHSNKATTDQHWKVTPDYYRAKFHGPKSPTPHVLCK